MKKIILILLTLALTINLSSCRRNHEMDNTTLYFLWRYAGRLSFVRRIVVDGEEIVGSREGTTTGNGLVAGHLGIDSPIFAHITAEQFQQNTNFLFYLNEAEARAAGHTDDVILAWPHEGAIEGISNRVYLETLRDERYAKEFAETELSLPLTLDDFVNEEENIINAVWLVAPETLLHASFIAAERGAVAFTEEIEIFRFAGTPELDVQVRERLEQMGLDFIEDFAKIQAMFEAAGSPEVFLANN